MDPDRSATSGSAVVLAAQLELLAEARGLEHRTEAAVRTKAQLLRAGRLQCR